MLKEVLTVSALIAVVLLVRAIFKNRVPKRMIYCLWLVVLLKLCLPGTLLSLPVLPAEKLVAPTQISELPAQTTPVIQQPAQTVMQPQTPAQQQVSPAHETAKPAAKPLATAQILQIVWFSGSALLGLWLFDTWLTFTIRLRKSRKFLGRRGKTNIYVSKRIKSPCLAGLIPAVYLTEDVLRNDTTELIVRHELTHLHHLDFLWSLCRTIAVIVYWWNPLIWLAAICSKRDAELACDEAVAAGLQPEQRIAYARAILAQAPRKKAALSLAGPPVKERILFLTKKQRTSAICIVLALALTVSATGCSFAELTRQKAGESTLSGNTEETEPPAAKEAAIEPAQTQLEEKQEAQPEVTKLPTPTASMFGLTGREATLYDAAVSQKYPRSDNDIVLPSLRVRGSFEEDGKTVVICDLHYDFYYDYTGPGWEWNGGGATTYLRAELETRSGAEICTGFAEYPSGNLSDWIRDFCGPLATQNADGAWVLPETAENWFPSDGSMLNEYLAAAEAIQKPTAILDGSIDLSAMSVDALGQLLDELNVSRPDGKKAQNEKWAAISTVKTELVNRAKESGYSYREPVTFETLNEMIGYRLMNNESLMNAFPDDAAQMEACRKENAAIETFLATLPESGSDEEAYAYWRQYWQDVLHQEAPSYFVPAMTLTIFALNTSPSSKKTYTLSAEDATVVETLFSIDSMTPATSDSESVCAYQFDIENRSYLLDDSRDYVDAIVRESDDDYKYYGKHLSDAEIEFLREIIEAYAE